MTKSSATQRYRGSAVITSFKVIHVTDFNRKPVCDFLLVNNTVLTYILCRTVCQIEHSINQIIAFDRMNK